MRSSAVRLSLPKLRVPLTSAPAVTALVPYDDTETGGQGTSLTISGCSEILGDCHLGDSIAVNGTCLTVTAFDADSFKVGIAPETLRRTNLGKLVTGSQVDLERAVSGEVRFGGHFVQGHVDCTAEIVRRVEDGNSLRLWFRPGTEGGEVLKYIVEKGYVCLDGASLTVTEVNDEEGTFGVMLVSYTQDKIIVSKKAVGESVNLEVDMVGKYIEKQVVAQVERIAGRGGLDFKPKEGSEVQIASEEFVERVARKILELQGKQ